MSPGYKTFFFMFNSTEVEISTAHKTNAVFLAFKLTYAVFIVLINVKMPTTVGI